jgi:hypothetical protein
VADVTWIIEVKRLRDGQHFGLSHAFSESEMTMATRPLRDVVVEKMYRVFDAIATATGAYPDPKE